MGTDGGWRLVLAVVAMGILPGCGDSEGIRRLAPRDVPYLEGVAVPAGFDLVDRNTEDYESGGRRWARHEYVGSADKETIRGFYKEQMPLLGWSRVTDHNVQGTITMRFEKPNEVCDIVITSGGMLHRTTIQAIVMPFQRPSTLSPRRSVP
jgi:hypothetical protein